jgi:hypothetical protein
VIIYVSNAVIVFKPVVVYSSLLRNHGGMIFVPTAVFDKLGMSCSLIEGEGKGGEDNILSS